MTTIVLSVANIEASVAVVEFLARVQLEAKRRGCEIRVCDVGEELRELIKLSGLEDVLLSGSVGSPR